VIESAVILTKFSRRRAEMVEGLLGRERMMESEQKGKCTQVGVVKYIYWVAGGTSSDEG
jgi:hypothetical protein